ncbi:MAG: hypothetical protein HQK76_14030 [Desulfobacterales bacterium]|nr:hypothetical protein [Desulfobacterales bacterium]
MKIKSCLLCNFFAIFLLSPSFAFNFDSEYKNEKLYLHEIVNYSLNPHWDNEWEKNYFKQNGIKLSFGSIASDKLLCIGDIVINQELDKNLTFRYFFKWRASKYRNTEEKNSYFGLEKALYNNISVFFMLNPAYNKDELDGLLGISIMDYSFEQYIRVSLCYDDFIYDKKNSMGGKTEKAPIGVKWDIRIGSDTLWLFSEGKYSSGFKRKYPIIELSPIVTSHEQQINDVILKLYLKINSNSLSEINYYHYHFYEVKKHYKNLDNYSYLNEINNISLKYMLSLTYDDRIRTEINYLFQNSKAFGCRDYKYHRHDFMPAIFYEHDFENTSFEIGYMSSTFNWDNNELNNAYTNSGYIDKIKMGWTYFFGNKAKLQLSVSHVLSVSGFGGGNLQYILIF